MYPKTVQTILYPRLRCFFLYKASEQQQQKSFFFTIWITLADRAELNLFIHWLYGAAKSNLLRMVAI